MVLALSIDKRQFRYGSSLFPKITASGYVSVGSIWIGDWQYLDNILPNFYWPFLNRSEPELTLKLRQPIEPDWELDTGMAGSGHGVITRFSGGPGHDGGYFDTALDGDKCSIEGQIVDATKICGISLQNGDEAITHEYSDANAVHSVLCNAGIGEIREMGDIVPVGAYFKYDELDKILIDVRDGLVRYYLVKNKPYRTMTLLRTTRSKLTADPKMEIQLYDIGAAWDRLWATQTNEATAEIEIVASLENFQDWKNDFFVASTADSLLMANNEPQFTFPNPKKRLRSISPNLGQRTKDFRLEMEAFFDYHGQEKEFLFVDKAKKDVNNESTEWWARFTAPFGDKSLNACLSMHNTQITESYRRDYVPIEVDETAPEVTLIDPGEPIYNTYPLEINITENALIKTAAVYVNDNISAEGEQPVDPLDSYADLIRVLIDTTRYMNETNAVRIVVTDWGGNTASSNAVNMDFFNV